MSGLMKSKDYLPLKNKVLSYDPKNETIDILAKALTDLSSFLMYTINKSLETIIDLNNLPSCKKTGDKDLLAVDFQGNKLLLSRSDNDKGFFNSFTFNNKIYDYNDFLIDLENVNLIEECVKKDLKFKVEINNDKGKNKNE